MRVMITGRHVTVTPALRRHIESRVKRLERYSGKLDIVQVILAVEKFRHIAEMTLTLNGARILGKAATREMYASVDHALDKILRQVRKRKEKLTDHKVRPVPARSSAPRSRKPLKPPVNTVQPKLQTLTLEGALEAIRQDSAEVLVFLNGDTQRVQVLRRLAQGRFELIDPRPSSPQPSLPPRASPG